MSLCRLKTNGRKHLPVGQGHYPVGCVDIMTEYSSTGCFTRLYYPSAQEDTLDRTMQWPLWMPSKEYIDGLASFVKIWKPLFRSLYNWFVGDVYIPAVWKAAPLRGMTFPLVIFSHGLGGFRTVMSTTCIELASHGFIVAAVEHRDHSACMSFYLKDTSSKNVLEESDSAGAQLLGSDGMPTFVTEWVTYQHPPPMASTYPIRNRQVYHRARECIKAMETILAINKGDHINNLLDSSFSTSMFLGIVDVSRIAVAGHSFGGASVIPTLANDRRIKAGVALDSWMFPLKDEEGLFSSVSQPILCINTQRFQTPENMLVMKRLKSENTERRIVTISGTIHYSQTDIPFILGSFIRMFIARSPTDRVLAKDLSNRLMISFLSKHLDLPPNETYEAYIDKNSNLLLEE